MAVVYKEYSLCEGAFIVEDPVIGDAPDSKITFNASPGWFTGIDSVDKNPASYSFTVPASGSYIITFVDTNSSVSTIKEIIIKVVPCFEVFSNCCDNQCNIVWFNRQGGHQNYIFTGIKTFEVQGGEAKTFITTERIKKYSEINRVYNGRICTTGPIPKSHVDLLDSLRYSIQAWLLVGDPADPNNYREIFIDRENWIKYTTRDKLFDVRIRFILAKEIVIQSQ